MNQNATMFSGKSEEKVQLLCEAHGDSLRSTPAECTELVPAWVGDGSRYYRLGCQCPKTQHVGVSGEHPCTARGRHMTLESAVWLGRSLSMHLSADVGIGHWCMILYKIQNARRPLGKFYKNLPVKRSQLQCNASKIFPLHHLKKTGRRIFPCKAFCLFVLQFGFI